MAQFPVFDIRNGTLIRYYGCSEHVVIPKGVTSIGEGAFNNYSGRKYVQRVTIPEGVTSIGEGVFYKCAELKEVIFPKGLTEIGARAFCDCRGLKQLKLPEGLTDIGEAAFAGCWYVTDMSLPEGLISIGPRAFSNCFFLTGLILPESLKHIGDHAFSQCWSLTEITIPAGVMSIGLSPFSGSSKLTSLTVPPENRHYKSVNNVLFSRDGLTLIACPGGMNGSYAIPEDVTSVSSGAFYACKSLTEVSFPKGVSVIEKQTFGCCEALQHVTLAEGLRAIGPSAFEGCKKLKNVLFPASLTEIGEYAFAACESLTELTLPTGLKRISPRLCLGCKSLKRVLIPQGVTIIDEWAFSGCTQLADLTLPAGLREIGWMAFDGCKALERLTIPAGVKKIKWNAFTGCVGLQKVFFPNSLEEIERDAFSDCLGLTEVWVPDCDGLSAAFRGCTHLEAFLVPLQSGRFRGEDGVVLSRDGTLLVAYPPGRRCERYDIPETVTEVGKYAFERAQVKLIVLHKGIKRLFVNAVDTEGDVPFVAHSFPNFMDVFSKPIYLGAPDDLQQNQLRKAIEGFVYAWRIGMPEIAPWVEQYKNLVRQDYAFYEKMAWNRPDLIRLLMDMRLLRTETAKNMTRKYERAGGIDLCAELRTYLAWAEEDR